MKKLVTIVVMIAMLATAFGISSIVIAADDDPATPNLDESLVLHNTTYYLTDTGWSEMYTETTDCVNGWGEDDWELTLTDPYTLNVTVRDCCTAGDYYAVYVNGVVIGTTPVVELEGAILSEGSFAITLNPGVYTIEIRNMLVAGGGSVGCPAGYWVTGELEGPILTVTKELLEDQTVEGGDMDGVLEMGEDWRWTFRITITNPTDATITDVKMHDRLGGDLEWHYVSCSGGGGLSEVDIYTRGKTEKVFIDWDIGTMGPGAEETMNVRVSPDINPGTGNGKKAGHQEYTSIGLHELNSGAYAEGNWDGIFVWDKSDPIMVEVFEDN
jgi:hypothetical protein